MYMRAAATMNDKMSHPGFAKRDAHWRNQQKRTKEISQKAGYKKEHTRDGEEKTVDKALPHRFALLRGTLHVLEGFYALLPGDRQAHGRGQQTERNGGDRANLAANINQHRQLYDWQG